MRILSTPKLFYIPNKLIYDDVYVDGCKNFSQTMSKCKLLYGYYNTFLGRGGLLYNLEHDTFLKPRVAALAAITVLLSDAKPFLAQAQHRFSFFCLLIFINVYHKIKYIENTS